MLLQFCIGWIFHIDLNSINSLSDLKVGCGFWKVDCVTANASSMH
ncbi:hypothetical protein BGLA2_60090 [Burkholderia gladioli]|nr:hypothetical protein BGLA2_60090 [Burkholderia gladioli]